MSCTNVRKLLYAFADGQLGVKDNCDVLDHLKMCPECSRVVDEHQELRAAIRQSLDNISAPTSLRAKLSAAGLPIGRQPPWVARMTSRHGFAIAAALLIGIIFLWRGLGDRLALGDRFASSTDQTSNVPRGATAASQIAQVHAACCAHGPKHHRKDLPTTLKELGAAMCAHYNHKIAALAPDLAAFGYRFESANYCGVRDDPGCEGCHIIYVADKAGAINARLSFFSVPRWDCLDKCNKSGSAINPDGCRRYQVDLDDGGSLSILAWHNDATTYICCGPEPIERMTPMIKQLRTAMNRAEHEVSLAAASHRQPE